MVEERTDTTAVENGLLLDVVWVYTGSEAAADTPVGADTIVLEDSSEYSVDDWVWPLGSGPYVITEVDSTTDTITLNEPLTIALEEDDPVVLDVGGQPGREWYAIVWLSDSVEPIHVPMTLHDVSVIPEGTREPPEAILVSSDYQRIVDLPGQLPKITGDYIPMDTLPIPGLPTEPPETSPTLSVGGTVDALVIRTTTPVDQSTIVEYHISTTPGFTPSESTRLGEVRGGGVYVTTKMPDGQPLLLDVDYYVRSVAKNDIGPAENPSPEVVGHLNPDAISELFATVLSAGFVAAGAIEVGQIKITPEGGMLIPQPNGGHILLPADGITQAQIDAYIMARGMTLTGDATFMDLVSVFGKIQLADGVSDPKARAAVTAVWNNAQYDLVKSEDGLTWEGLALAPDGVVAATTAYFVGEGFIRRFSTVDGFWYGDTLLGNWRAEGGITRIGGVYYLLGYTPAFSSSQDWEIRRFNATTMEEIGTAFDVPMNPVKSPAIGNDGTDVLIAIPRVDNTIGVSVRSASTLVQSAFDLLNVPGQVVFDISYVGRGNFDLSAQSTFIVPKDANVNGGKVLAFNASLVRLSTRDFLRAGGTRVHGMWWNGTIFKHLDASGRLWDYGADNPLDSTVYASYTWYDGDSTGGTHETAAAPATEFQWPARSRLVVTGRNAPHESVTDASQTDKANLVRIYLGFSAAAMRLQETLPLHVVNSRINTINTTSPIAPLSSTFSGSGQTPGVIESIAVDANGKPLWRFGGDGAARAAQLVQAGKVTVAMAGAAQQVVTVTFPIPFSAPPIVTGTAGHQNYFVSVGAVTNTNVILRVRHQDGATGTPNVQLNWHAVAETV